MIVDELCCQCQMQVSIRAGCWPMNDQQQNGEKYPWAGPLLFSVVLIGLIFFFRWFLSAGG